MSGMCVSLVGAWCIHIAGSHPGRQLSLSMHRHQGLHLFRDLLQALSSPTVLSMVYVELARMYLALRWLSLFHVFVRLCHDLLYLIASCVAVAQRKSCAAGCACVYVCVCVCAVAHQ